MFSPAPSSTQPTSVSSRLRAKPKTPPRKLNHFIEHDVGKAFDFGRAVTDFADDADIRRGDGRFDAGDLDSSSWRMLLMSEKRE